MVGGLDSILGFLDGDASPKKSKSNKVEEKIKRFETMFHADRKWRDKKSLWENFYDGYHWTDEELQELEKRKQPDVVYNRIKTSIDVVVGLEQRFRQRMRAFPRDSDLDQAVADAMSEAMRFVGQNNKLDFVNTDVFEEGAKSGRGWFHLYIEPDEMNQPEVKIEWVPNDDILFDRSSVKYDLSDAKDLSHTVWMNIDDVYALFPKKRKKINEAIHFLDFGPVGFSQHKTFAGDDYAKRQESRTSSDLWFDREKKEVRIVNYWYRVNELRKVLVHPDLGFFVLDKNLSDEALGETIQLVREELQIEPSLIEKHVRMAHVCTYIGNTILEEKESPFQNDKFPYIPFFGFKESKTGDHYGLIKQAIDPQRELNKRRSKALHLLNSKQVIYEDGAFEDEEEARQELSRPDGFIPKRKGYDVDIRDDRNLGNAQLEMYNISSKEIDDTMGVNREILGQQSNIRSAKGLERKISQGMMVLARLFSNWKLTQILLHEQILMFIQEYWTAEKAIRVTNDQQVTQFIRFNKVLNRDENEVPFNEFVSRKFDIILDVGEDSLNIQEETFNELAKLAQTGQIPPDILLEFAPVPFATKQRILALLRPSPQDPTASGSESDVNDEEAVPSQVGQPESPIRLLEGR